MCLGFGAHVKKLNLELSVLKSCIQLLKSQNIASFNVKFLVSGSLPRPRKEIRLIVDLFSC